MSIPQSQTGRIEIWGSKRWANCKPLVDFFDVVDYNHEISFGRNSLVTDPPSVIKLLNRRLASQAVPSLTSMRSFGSFHLGN